MLLHSTSLGSVKRFRKIYKVFPHENTPIQRNELVSILVKMYRQYVIGPIEYRQINNKLAQFIGSGFEESLEDRENQSIGENMVIEESNDEENDENEEEDELLRLINLTFNHIVQDDKEELVKLIDELKEIITSDTLIELEKAVCEFLIREKRNGKSILPIIYDLLRELENSFIPLSKQLRLKMLIDDQNRYRIKSVFKWLDVAEDNDQDILKRLTRKEHLSQEQFKKLSALDDLTDLEAVADIVKDTKVGQ